MGGRGTYAIGNNVEYTYKTVGEIEGVKVLKGLGTKHGLPEESHMSASYISLYNDGSVKQMRLYNKDHTSFIDIDYSIHQGKKTLHAHDYFDGKRQKARNLSKTEIAKYGKYFGGEK